MKTLVVVVAFLAVLLTPQGGYCNAANIGGIYALPVVWQDDQGQVMRLADLGGLPLIITMAYGTCRKVCSTSIRRMEEVQALADERKIAMNFVVVSLDPTSDTPREWQAFRRAKKLERANWHFIRGRAQDTRLLARLLGIGYWVYDDHVVHDFRVLRIDEQGEIAAALNFADDAPATLIDMGK